MDLGDWEGLAAAQVGAVAALAGLIFVALSINLTKILALPGLTGRAAEALILLLLPLFVGLAILTPHQSAQAVGVEVLIVAGFITALTVRILLTSGRIAAKGRPNHEYVLRFTMVALAVLPMLMGGALLAAGSTSGLYWLSVGTATSIAVGVLDAWVLLVEILR